MDFQCQMSWSNELSDMRGIVDTGVTVDHYCSFHHISYLSHVTHMCLSFV
jgi:hypothetical protein